MKSVSTLKELAAEQPDLRILYVEDDNSLRENTLRLMSSFFNTVDSAVNGQEGLEKYQQGQYDIVISDLRMPIMDGISMVGKIKELNSDQLVIITSAHDETDYLLKLIAMGVESFILKPLDVEQFLTVLIKTLKTVRLRKLEIEYKTKIEQTNKKIMDSIEYARRIQASLLPNLAEVKQHLPDSFFLWQPRDVVGGDIYTVDFLEEGFIVSLMDCTGHGVPGALMTMIAASELRRIIRDEKSRDPADILKQLNFYIKTSLQQDTSHAKSDDGLEAAVCHVDLRQKTLSFSGARQPLVVVSGGNSEFIKGDRVSIGYKSSDLSHDFKRHTIALEPGKRFYLFSDGFVDQIGGEKPVSFGKSRLVRLLEEICENPFADQKTTLQQAFQDFRGKSETRDDYTVVGFKI